MVIYIVYSVIYTFEFFLSLFVSKPLLYRIAI